MSQPEWADVTRGTVAAAAAATPPGSRGRFTQHLLQAHFDSFDAVATAHAVQAEASAASVGGAGGGGADSTRSTASPSMHSGGEDAAVSTGAPPRPRGSVYWGPDPVGPAEAGPPRRPTVFRGSVASAAADSIMSRPSLFVEQHDLHLLGASLATGTTSLGAPPGLLALAPPADSECGSAEGDSPPATGGGESSRRFTVDCSSSRAAARRMPALAAAEAPDGAPAAQLGGSVDAGLRMALALQHPLSTAGAAAPPPRMAGALRLRRRPDAGVLSAGAAGDGYVPDWKVGTRLLRPRALHL